MTGLGNSLLNLLPEAKLIRLKGYSNGNTDYTEAKKPKDKWQEVPALSREEAKAWEDQHGWLGLEIPEGYILIDVDDKQTGQAVHEALSGRLRCITIETPNGYQFFFKDTGKVKSQSTKMLTVGGLVVDYRTANKGYIVLPTENTENRKVVHEHAENLDDMPLMFIPARRVNENETTLQIPINKGSRNDTLFRNVASRIKGLNEKHRLGLTDEDRLTVMREINQFFCSPSLLDREIEEIFKSSDRYESTTLPVTNEKKSFDLDHLFINADEFLKSGYVPEDYPEIIEGILPEGSLVAIFAPSSTYKSWLAQGAAVNVSQGKPFLGRRTTQRKVIYIDLENRKGTIHERLTKLSNGGELNNLELWTLFNDEQPPIFPNNIYAEIAERYKPLIIFDALIRFLPRGADENSAKDMAGVMKFLKELTRHGATVLVLHHKGKSDQSDFRGSSDILAGLDVAYTLSKDTTTNRLTLKCIKNRDAQEETIIIGINGMGGEHMSFENITTQEREIKAKEHEGKYYMLQGIMSRLEKEGIETNQKNIVEAAKGDIGLSDHKTREYLENGLDRYWYQEKNGNHKVYKVKELGSFATPLYDEKQKSSEEIPNISELAPDDSDFPHEQGENMPLIGTEVTVLSHVAA